MKPLKPENDFSPLRLAKSVGIFAASGPVLLAGLVFVSFVAEWRGDGLSEATRKLKRLDLELWAAIVMVASAPGALLGVVHYLLVLSKLMRQREAKRRPRVDGKELEPRP